ncbi:hypothetical protein P22_2857 [Propionispora sp. 2/2-37]|uniref:ROK family transcriptional regulator n=1 Tax=Propionispora sp. 2/2-37 TaxID=1677858 RepID=UPI0006C097D9|nr:ROK family transcriptional regulator [Propionispora sp. 2/2-37]CUH96746.1 hypothetical protein P22_2857 [Propionispora sp. 2/2-37]
MLMAETNNINLKAVGGPNEALVVNTVRRRGPISRVDIAKLTGLTAPTVTNISGKLIEAGIMSEYMIGEYSGGRRPVLLKANPDMAKMVIADIRSKEVAGYIINAGLEISKQIRKDTRHLDKDAVLAAMLDIIAALCSAEEGEAVAAIGIIVRGPVRSAEGVSLFSPSTGWRNVPLKFIVEGQFHIPTFVENDMRAMALGSYHYGPYRDIRNAVFLGVGGGIGSGIILNGELYRGLGDSAGEIGHSAVDIDGPVCSCGNRGCLEAMASETALVNLAVQAVKEGHTSLITDMVNQDIEAVKPEHIYAAAEQGDGLAVEVLHNVARYLGVGVSNVINIFNPELVIIGGGITKGYKFIEDSMMEVIKQRVLESCYASVRIECSAEGRAAALNGIVDLVMQGLILNK